MVERNSRSKGDSSPYHIFSYGNYRPVVKNYPDFLTTLWLSSRPYVLRVFMLDSFRRTALRCLECKPPLSAWPYHMLLTSRITQPHAVPRVQHSSLTANRHNIYILHLHHIKTSCRLNMQSREQQERERECVHPEEKSNSFQTGPHSKGRRMSWYHKSSMIKIHGIPINVPATNEDALA